MILYSIASIAISIDGSPWLLVVLLLLAIGLSAWLYKTTVPEIGPFTRWILTALRAFAFCLLLVLLFHPIVTLEQSVIQKPDIAVLVDNSRSLQISDGGRSRAEVVNEILQHPIWETLAKQHNLHFFPFSTELDTTEFRRPEELNLSFEGGGTNIARALLDSKQRLLDLYFSGTILISDGNYNLGENPEYLARSFAAPIFTVGIGNPEPQKDIVLSRLRTNDLVYARNKVPVEITVSHSGFAGKSIQVFLKQGNQTVDRKTIRLVKDQEAHLTLEFRSEKPGFQRFSVEIPPLEGEFTARNNQREFVVNVLESKIRVLLLAGVPSLDLKFLKRIIEEDQNIELTTLVQSAAGGFYQKIPVSELEKKKIDLFVLLEFPLRPLTASFRDYLKKELLENKKPFFYIQGRQSNPGLLREFGEVLPFTTTNHPSNPREIVVTPAPAGLSSQIIMLEELEAENTREWNDLPPVGVYLQNFRPVADAEILLQADPLLSRLPISANQTVPVLFSRQIDSQKVLCLMAFNFWRWDFMMWGIGKSNEHFRQFLARSVRWLNAREDLRPVRAQTDKPVYRSGDPVYIQATVNTNDLRPVDDAEVVVSVKKPSGSFQQVLRSLGEGRYESQFRVLEGGEYEFIVTARRNDQFFGADSGRFSVGEIDIEFQHLEMNESLLKQVAEQSGGAYFTPENFGDLGNMLTAKGRTVVRTREWNFWSEWLTLLAFLVLMATEWTIRRRRGML